jgi:hypothetical protein
VEGHIYNATIIHSKKEGFGRSVSQGRKIGNRESEVRKMNTAGFLWMSSGAAVIGTTIYLLSFIIL